MVLAWLEGGGRADATCERDGVSGITLLMVAANCGNERVVELEPSPAHKPLCNSSKLTQHPVVEKMCVWRNLPYLTLQ